MRFFSLVLLFASLLFTACGGDAPATESSAEVAPTSSAYAAAAEALAAGKPASEISQLLLDNFAAVSDPASGTLNMAASKDYSKLAQALSDKYPNDTMAALPLYKAAEVVRAMNDAPRAATIYKTVTERYPDFSKAAEAMFMLAFTYDEDLKDLDQAKATYEMFLEKYPNHSFADDSEMLLRNLGKSDEEILRELEARQGE